MLDAGELKFCDAVDEAFTCFPGGVVLTLKGDVNPVAFVELAVDVEVLLFNGGVFLVGAGPVVLRSCGEATPVEEVESAYLQLADGFGAASKPGDCAPGEV